MAMSAKDVMEIAMGFQKTQVLYTATSLDVFEELNRSASPMSALKLANRLNLNADATERLLNACSGLALLEKTFNKNGLAVYQNSACSEMYLANSSPASMKPLIAKVGDLYNIFGHLKDGVREGKRQLNAALGHGDSCFNEGSGFYSNDDKKLEFLQTMHMFSKCDAASVTRAFDLTQFKSTIDLGGGTGALGLALAVANPKMRVTVSDLGQVMAVTPHFLPKPKPDNLFLDTKDFFRDSLTSADLYVLSHVVHDWDEIHLDQLLRKVYEAITPGGAILVLEKVLNENKDGPLMTLIFDLGMLISADGRERTTLEYKRLLEKHGFIDVQIKILPDARFRDAILARKPTSGHYDLEK